MKKEGQPKAVPLSISFSLKLSALKNRFYGLESVTSSPFILNVHPTRLFNPGDAAKTIPVAEPEPVEI